MFEAILAAENPLGFLAQFGVEWRLLISQALSFAIVAGALYYFVFKPVIAVSTKRQQEIEEGLNNAEKAREKLASAEEEVRQRLKKTAEEASKILQEAQDSAKKTVEDAVKQASEKASEIFDKGVERLEGEKNQMKEDLKKELATLVVNATENVVGEILTDEQRSALAKIAAEKLREEEK